MKNFEEKEILPKEKLYNENGQVEDVNIAREMAEVENPFHRKTNMFNRKLSEKERKKSLELGKKAATARGETGIYFKKLDIENHNKKVIEEHKAKIIYEKTKEVVKNCEFDLEAINPHIFLTIKEHKVELIYGEIEKSRPRKVDTPLIIKIDGIMVLPKEMDTFFSTYHDFIESKLDEWKSKVKKNNLEETKKENYTNTVGKLLRNICDI